MLKIIKGFILVLITSLIGAWLGINYFVYKELEEINQDNTINFKI
jgi:hypothetical protein